MPSHASGAALHAMQVEQWQIVHRQLVVKTKCAANLVLSVLRTRWNIMSIFGYPYGPNIIVGDSGGV